MYNQLNLQSKLGELAQAAKRQQQEADQAALVKAPAQAPTPAAPTIVDLRALPPG